MDTETPTVQITMRYRGGDRAEIAQAPALAGESWTDAAVRLYNQHLGFRTNRLRDRRYLALSQSFAPGCFIAQMGFKAGGATSLDREILIYVEAL